MTISELVVVMDPGEYAELKATAELGVAAKAAAERDFAAVFGWLTPTP